MEYWKIGRLLRNITIPILPFFQICLKNIVMKKFTVLVQIFFVICSLSAQNKKEITLEDIWVNGTFKPENIWGLQSMNDGLHYTSLENDEKSSDTYLIKYDYKTGKEVDRILKESELTLDGSKPISIDEYWFSNDESKVLISTETDRIYRHSTRENYYVYDLKIKKLTKVTAGDKQMYGTFSPDGNKVAFVRNNDIFIKDLLTGIEMRVTYDGKQNNIINGATDWVYEEEFAFDRAYFWSPDGKKVAYYRFDESEVNEFEMSEYQAKLYPSVYKFKYPKAGERNSLVKLFVFDIKTETTVEVKIPKEKKMIDETKNLPKWVESYDYYIPRVKWTNDPNALSFEKMNRLQNKLELILTNASTGDSKVVLTEECKTYIEITDDLTFLKDKKRFIWTSDLAGYNHIFLYEITGKLIKQLTKGNWDVTEFKGVDEDAKTVYYTSTEVSATEKYLYSVKLDGSGKKKISSNKKGTNDVNFSNGHKYFINSFSDVNSPEYFSLHSNDGKLIRVLESNDSLNLKLKQYSLSKKEFFTFKTSQNIELNGWMMKPVNFDPNKKYPVFMTFYGGPGHNEVLNDWNGSNYFWHSLLTQKGYIVACVDNRGTGGRGREFKSCTYKQLGKLETIDQIETAKYLGSLAYVDKTRIGVQGWSFGGYLASLCMTKGADYFKTGIAVAPVTNWRFYDTIYTERYLSTPQDNPSGYDDNSPINFTDLLKGKYLLIHGTADDNVHLQNSIEMSRALIKSNKQFQQFFYPDKNHSIYGGNTRLHLYTQMTNFILENL